MQRALIGSTSARCAALVKGSTESFSKLYQYALVMSSMMTSILMMVTNWVLHCTRICRVVWIHDVRVEPVPLWYSTEFNRSHLTWRLKKGESIRRQLLRSVIPATTACSGLCAVLQRLLPPGRVCAALCSVQCSRGVCWLLRPLQRTLVTPSRYGLQLSNLLCTLINIIYEYCIH